MTIQERTQMKRYWMDGDRLDAFALYLIASIPNDWVKYASRLPVLNDQLDALDSIEGFQPILAQLIKNQ